MEFFNDCIIQESVKSDSVNDFVHAVTIWISQAHVVDKRLNCAIVVRSLNYDECLEYVQCLCNEKNFRKDWQRYLMSLKSDSTELQIIIRKLIPKRTDIFSTTSEIVILGIENTNAYASFIMLPSDDNCMPSYAYQFSFQLDANKYSMCLKLAPCSDQQCSSLHPPKKPRQTTDWLKKHLMHKLISWTEQQYMSRLNNKKQFPMTMSISLVEKEEYAILYQNLKLKYGKKWITAWPEKTDPYKFVYEDISIATYILLLWKAEREEKGTTKLQSFVDLGCGNGLLVHILQSEGHSGKGIDIRRRKIWDLYGNDTILEVKAFVPSNGSVFSEADWIIGNHCDELTPWIPVIAARSSYRCSYFVLPCCLYNFNGKFARRDANESQYRAYLNYICDIGKTCGFKVEEDRLRLPSTKRICQIGRKRSYESSESEEQDRIISEMLSKVSSSNPISVSLERKHIGDSDYHIPSNEMTAVTAATTSESDAKEQPWSQNFKPREPIELTSNCKQLSRTFKDEFVLVVANKLLELPSKRVFKPISIDQESKDDNFQTWNRGGELTLDTVASLFERSAIQQLKNECGGIKTLLKLFHQVFIGDYYNDNSYDDLYLFYLVSGKRVLVSGNTVRIRDWSSYAVGKKEFSHNDFKSTKDKLYKTKLCWFHAHHPDGCPLGTDMCTYAHGESELKQRPNTNSL